MALRKCENNILPENAVKLTYAEALVHQIKLFDNWKRKEDVWAIRNYPYIIGSGTLISTIFFNHHFRYKCRLMNLGRSVSYLPAIAVPTFLSILDHHKFAVQNVIMDNCLLCTTIKSVVSQLFFGITIPIFLGASGSYVIAAGYHTIDIPPINQYQKLFELFKKHLFAAKRPLIFLSLMNAVLSGSLVLWEHQNFKTVQSKVDEQDEQAADNYKDRLL